MKQNLIIFGAIVALVVALSVLGKKYTEKGRDNARLSQNQTALFDSVHHYKTKTGDNAASVQVLTLKKKELKKLLPNVAQEAKSAGIKSGRILAYSEIGSQTKVNISVPVMDSAVKFRSRIDTFKCINYRDNWTTVIGCSIRDTFRGKVAIFDTLTTILHRVPKRFLFIKYGTKSVKLDIISKNPHTQISYAKYVTIQ